MSIAQVAQTAGVSQASVSRVINKRPGVSPNIVKAVRAAMGTLGYQPPPLERRPGRRSAPVFADKMVSSIGVVLLDNLYQYTPGIFVSHLRGIELEAADHGLATVVAHLKKGESLPPTITGGQIQGLVLMGSSGSPQVLRFLQAYASVWLSSHHGPGGDTVLAGNHAIAKLAAEYLLKRGHKHLAYLAVMASYPAYPARAEAFRFFALQANARADVLMDDTTPDDPEFPSLGVLQGRIESLVDRFAKLAPRPSGLFVGNDMMAAMSYVALQKRGIVPGRDVDLISCNNEQSYLVGLDPRPATIDIGAEMIGRRTVEQLLRKIRRPEETRSVQIAISPVLVEPS